MFIRAEHLEGLRDKKVRSVGKIKQMEIIQAEERDRIRQFRMELT